MIAYVAVLVDYRDRLRSFKGEFFRIDGCYCSGKIFTSKSFWIRQRLMHCLAPAYGYVKKDDGTYLYFRKLNDGLEFVYLGMTKRLSGGVMRSMQADCLRSVR